MSLGSGLRDQLRAVCLEPVSLAMDLFEGVITPDANRSRSDEFAHSFLRPLDGAEESRINDHAVRRCEDRRPTPLLGDR